MRSHIGRLVCGIALILAASLDQGVAAAEVDPDVVAAGTRLHTLQINVCDGYLQDNPTCAGTTPTQKASNIYNLIQASDWRATIVTLQEVCGSTISSLMARLGSAWSYYRIGTVTFPDEARCQSSDRTWGIAVLVKGDIYSFYSEYLGSDADKVEGRWLLCGDVSMGRGQRVCATHLTPSNTTSNRNANYNQFVKVRSRVGNWALGGTAISLGADLNRNVRSCDTTGEADLEVLRQLYATSLGPSGCATSGYGEFYEADRRYSGSGDTVDEVTYPPSKKIDFYFVNKGRFASDYGGKVKALTGSDHKALHAAVTVT